MVEHSSHNKQNTFLSEGGTLNMTNLVESVFIYVPQYHESQICKWLCNLYSIQHPLLLDIQLG